ncbi:hypothetical protein ACLOJK_037055 [Asimina triloba]
MEDRKLTCNEDDGLPATKTMACLEGTRVWGGLPERKTMVPPCSLPATIALPATKVGDLGSNGWLIDGAAGFGCPNE